MASIRKDKQTGKWIVDFKRGLTRRRVKFSTRSEALDFKKELLLRKEGRAPNEVRTLLTDAIKAYVSTVTALKSIYSRKYEPLVLNHFCEHVGNVYVQDISLFELEAYQTLLNKKFLGQTCNRRFTIIKHLFKKCVDWGYLERIPTEKLRNLRPANLKAKRALSRGELTTLLVGAPPWLRDVLWFIVETGVRRSQAGHLHWSSVDWTNSQVHLESSEGFETKDRKVHTLPMTEDVHVLLKDLYEQARRGFRAKPKDFVFVDDRGERIRPDRLTHEAKKLLVKRLGIVNGAVHVLRHTSLTLRHREGVSLDTVRQIAGHSNVRTTQIYLQADGEHLRKEMVRTSPIPLHTLNRDGMAPNGTDNKNVN